MGNSGDSSEYSVNDGQGGGGVDSRMALAVVAVGMMSLGVIYDDADNGSGNSGSDVIVVLMMEMVVVALTVRSCQ